MNPRQLWLVGFFTTLMVVNGSAREPWPTKRWPTSAPRAVGLDSKALADLDQDLVNGKYGHVDSMLIIRHGKLVCDRSYKHDYDQIYGPESDLGVSFRSCFRTTIWWWCSQVGTLIRRSRSLNWKRGLNVF